MSTLRQIPVHMLLLAGLVGPLAAKEDKKSSASAAAQPAAVADAAKVAYAGLHVADLSDQDRTTASSLPAGVGIRVGFIDPAGPSVDVIEEGDIITRFDDQVVVNRDQFRALVRMRKPGDTVKLTVVRGAEPKVVDLKLGETKATRNEPQARDAVPTPFATLIPRIVVNGQEIDLNNDPSAMVTQVGPNNVVIIGPNNAALPAEVRKRLEEMRARGMQIQPDIDNVVNPPAPQHPRSVQRSTSRSFSFGTGGASSSSSSIAVDGNGSVSLEEKDGKKHAVIKDPSGKVIFDGDVTTDELRAKMPEEARRRLKLVEGNKFSIPGFNTKDPVDDQQPVPGAEETPAKPQKKKKFKPEEGA